MKATIRNKHFISSIIITLLFVSFIGTAFAAKGVVVYTKSGCDYFIVETLSGYALL
jgi:hypothetical protein